MNGPVDAGRTGVPRPRLEPDRDRHLPALFYCAQSRPSRWELPAALDPCRPFLPFPGPGSCPGPGSRASRRCRVGQDVDRSVQSNRGLSQDRWGRRRRGGSEGRRDPSLVARRWPPAARSAPSPGRSCHPRRVPAHWESYKSGIAAYPVRQVAGTRHGAANRREARPRRPGCRRHVVRRRSRASRRWAACRRRRASTSPSWVGCRQLARAQMFDNLIGNLDTNQGNWLVDSGWNLILIDHTRAFTTDKSLVPQEVRPTSTAPHLWEKMQALTLEALTTKPWHLGRAGRAEGGAQAARSHEGRIRQADSGQTRLRDQVRGRRSPRLLLIALEAPVIRRYVRRMTLHTGQLRGDSVINEHNAAGPSRRAFIRDAAGAAVVTSVAGRFDRLVGAHAAGSDEIRVGLVGCGGRGTGAAGDVLTAAPGVQARRAGRRLRGPARGTCREALAQARTRTRQRGARTTASSASTPTRSCSRPTSTTSSWRRRRASARSTSRRPSTPARHLRREAGGRGRRRRPRGASRWPTRSPRKRLRDGCRDAVPALRAATSSR